MAIFLNHLVVTHGTVGAIRDAVYGINWAHHASGYISPTEDPFVKLVHKGAERLCAKPRSKKDPLTAPFMKALYDHYRPLSGSRPDLKILRFLLIAMLGFAGFFRIEELLSTKLTNVHVYGDHMTIFLPKCKTDQLRQGNTVYIARLGSRYCPVGLLEDFLSAANIRLPAVADEHLIPRLIKVRGGHKIHPSLGISDTTAREVFATHIQVISKGGLKFSPHSLRAGGASEAAHHDVGDRLISLHGRWKSGKARDGYIQDALEARLTVSKSLGL